MQSSRGELPLYLQLAAQLQAEIEKGTYRPGARIPTEAQLGQQYGVSRVTIRSALRQLEEAGYLVRRRGAGTFIRTQKYLRPMAEDISFTAMCERLGLKAGAKTIKSVLEEADSDDIALLHLPPHAAVAVLERIRYADGRPISLETTRFLESYRSILGCDLTDRSLYQLLRENYQIDFTHTGKQVEIVFASHRLSAYLNVAPGYPLLKIESCICLPDGSPFARNLQYILGDQFKMQL